MTEGVDSGKTPRRTHDRLRKLLHGVVGDETRSGAPASGAQTVAARRRELRGKLESEPVWGKDEVVIWAATTLEVEGNLWQDDRRVDSCTRKARDMIRAAGGVRGPKKRSPLALPQAEAKAVADDLGEWMKGRLPGAGLREAYREIEESLAAWDPSSEPQDEGAYRTRYVSNDANDNYLSDRVVFDYVVQRLLRKGALPSGMWLDLHMLREDLETFGDLYEFFCTRDLTEEGLAEAVRLHDKLLSGDEYLRKVTPAASAKANDFTWWNDLLPRDVV